MTDDSRSAEHVPLNELTPGPVITAGRAHSDDDGTKFITNVDVSIEVDVAGTWPDGALVRVIGSYDGERIEVESHETVASGRRPLLGARRDFPLAQALRARAAMNSEIRDFFDDRGFLEVETQALVPSPGTDVHLDPIRVELMPYPGATRRTPAYLHTSPEFAMKRLLTAGCERIYQLGKVWRNGEVTAHHNPEFTLLEWYRAWRGVDAIIDDVEALVREVLPEHLTAHGPHGSIDVRLDRDIPRMTMQEVVMEACGFDILECLELDSLAVAIAEKNLFNPTDATSWADLFAELQVTVLDPWFTRKRAVFVTHWPTPVAVLARRDAADPRQSERFELYIGGVELANGFGELTDPAEQRARFVEDDAERFARRLPRLPMPELFLESLHDGMPPSAGVAVGVDRLLMLQQGATTITDVCPFALRGDLGEWTFG